MAFKTKIIVHIILFLLLCWLIDLFIISGIKKIRTEQFGVWNRIEKGEINSEIVFAGSSRCWLHLAPKPVSEATGRSCFNIGMDGSSPRLQQTRLNLFLDKNDDCKVIFQEVSLIHLEWQKEIYNKKQYLPYLNNESVFRTLKEIDNEIYLYKYLPLYGIVQQNQFFTEQTVDGWKQYITGKYLDDHDNGFFPMELKWDGKAEEFKRNNKNGIEFPVDSQALAVLDSMISSIKSRGIETVLVFTPEYTGIRSYIKNRAEILNIYKKLAEKHHIPFWDYSEHPMCADQNNFYNSEHMKGTAAIRFSKSFGEDVSKFLKEKGI